MWITMGLQPTEALAGPNGPCSGKRFYVYHGLSAEKIRERVKNLIGCATNRWSVAGGYSKALSVADCESGLNPYAVGGNNYGVFQLNIRYYPTWAERYLERRWFPRLNRWPPSPLKARANVITGVRLAHAVGSWSPWACA
jgi:hypothetical protein